MHKNFMLINKKNTFEQHDNENISFYKSSIKQYSDFSNQWEDNLSTDICVIGGGLTGVSSALNLSKKGFKVILVEARKIGWGASGRNGGQLGIGMRKDQPELEKTLGNIHANQLWKLGLEAVDEVKDYISKYKIECNIVKGVISAGCFKKDEKDFLTLIDHMQKKYDFNDFEFLNNKQIKQEINSTKYYSGILNNRSYHINPLKLLLGLASELIKNKVKIIENTPVKKIDKKNNDLQIITNKGTIKAKKIVVACNGYLDNLLGNIRNNFMPINNYVIATEPLGEDRARSIIKNNYAVSDTRFIINYYRFSEDHRLIFGGGETFTSHFVKKSKEFVRKEMIQVFPSLVDCKIDYSWGGTLAITVNRLPDFGSIHDDRIIYAHGFSGHGLALSVLAGKIISEKIAGNNERFNFFEKIKHFSIPFGDLLRRPIYSSAIFYYKLRDSLS